MALSMMMRARSRRVMLDITVSVDLHSLISSLISHVMFIVRTQQFVVH